MTLNLRIRSPLKSRDSRTFSSISTLVTRKMQQTYHISTSRLRKQSPSTGNFHLQAFFLLKPKSKPQTQTDTGPSSTRTAPSKSTASFTNGPTLTIRSAVPRIGEVRIHECRLRNSRPLLLGFRDEVYATVDPRRPHRMIRMSIGLWNNLNTECDGTRWEYNVENGESHTWKDFLP